ncbi:PAS domain-containing sensor histidine kinase [Chitinimonas lacunae]|uniref:histidine kinase n=1 Tax=Chitinimonas lacunae TaxID=1963018 RepID=A0ABV8MSX3_9NEIS
MSNPAVINSLPRLSRRANWLWAMPNLAMLCFLAAGAALLLFLNKNERESRREALIKDVMWQEQTLKVQIQGHQNYLIELARDYARRELTERSFYTSAASLVANNSELVAVALTNEYGEAVWSYPANAVDPLRTLPAVLEPLQRSARIGLSSSTPVFDYPGAGPAVALAQPSMAGNHTVGAFVAVVSLKRLLRNHVPWWIAQRYQINVIDLQGEVVAARLEQEPIVNELTQELALDPPGYGLRLRATAYQTSGPLWLKVLYGVLAGLSLLMLWSLWVLKRHMRERLAAEKALTREMSYRRAMEDSLVSGMRAMDMEGRITYVNRAFCRMVGFEAHELIGRKPPMPYWPPESTSQCEMVYAAIRRGECPPNGFSVRFMRKSGERFDVRLYASPLIDGHGQQTGWMASLNDVTELKREPEALKASHERFVAVLNGVDAAVAVTDRDSGELLMSNRAFRESFQLPEGDGPLCALPLRQAGKEGEVFDPVATRWYQVRRRESVWVDQSLVWLDIATDITEKKLAGERERQQAEKLQQTARLVAMGEMASSLAHELNQPLAAISSYGTACRNLSKMGQLPPEDLDTALDRITEQARRAGEIIRGIREFVHRREPKRTACQIDELIDTVLPLLGAPLRKQNVRLVERRGSELPVLYADRVMLEQVLFNLIKNAIEAMADTPPEARELTIETSRRGHQLVITVADRGRGIEPEQMTRLFQPFYSTKPEGMGMGLNICRSIVEYHHGRLGVEANPGGGSRFTVSLPLALEIAHAN